MQKITFAAEGIEEVEFNDMNGNIKIDRIDQPFEFGINFQTKQGNMAGLFEAKGSVSDLFDSKGVLTKEKIKSNIEATAKDLPVDGIDQMLAFQGVLSAALGNKLDLSFKSTSAADVADVVLTAKAPNLDANINLKVSEGLVTLSKPGNVDFIIHPDLVTLLTTQSDPKNTFTLTDSVPVKLTLKTLNSSVQGFNPSAVGLSADLSMGDGQFTGDPTIGKVGFKNIKASLDIPSLAESIKLNMSGSIDQNGERGGINVEANITDLFDSGGLLQSEKMKADINASITDLPVGPIDRLAGQDGLLVDAIGSTLNLNVKAKTDSNATNIDLSVRSSKFETNLPLAISDSVSLRSPGNAKYILTDSLMQQFIGSDTGMSLTKDVPITVELTQFSVPLPKENEPSFQPDQTKLQIQAKAGDVHVKGVPSTESLVVKGINLDFKGENLSSFKITFSGDLIEPDPKGLLSVSLGPVAKSSIEINGGLDKNGAPKTMDIKFDLKSQNLNGNLQGRLDDRFTITKPASFNYKLTSALLEMYAPAEEGQSTLSGSVPLNITIEKLSVPVEDFKYEKIDFAAKSKISEMSFTGDMLKGTSLKNTSCNVAFDGGANKMVLDLNSDCFTQGRKEPAKITVDGKFDGIIKEDEFDFDNAKINLTVKTDNLPTVLVETFSGMTGQIEPIIGPELKVDILVNRPEIKKGEITLKAESQRMNVNAGFNISEFVSLKNPAVAKLTLTPESFDALMALAETEEKDETLKISLAETAVLTATLKELKWPLESGDKEQSFDPSAVVIKADLSLPKLAILQEPNSEITRIEGLTASINGNNLTKPISLNLATKIKMALPGKSGAPVSDLGGDIKVSGNIVDLINSAGEINDKGMTIQMKIAVADVPGPGLDVVLAGEGYLTAILGEEGKCDSGY